MQSTYDLPKIRMSREDRKDQIFQILQSCWGLTTPGLARAIGLSRSPYLREILDEMESDGQITMTCYVLENGWQALVWRIAPEYAINA
jgi:hypothetical protein